LNKDIPGETRELISKAATTLINQSITEATYNPQGETPLKSFLEALAQKIS